MRVLLDECLPRRLKRELVGHDAPTVPDMGWASKQNGDLLCAAVASGFEAFVTVDRNLQHQQHLSTFAIAVIVLEAVNNTLGDLRPLIPELLTMLPMAPVRSTLEHSEAHRSIGPTRRPSYWWRSSDRAHRVPRSVGRASPRDSAVRW